MISGINRRILHILLFAMAGAAFRGLLMQDDCPPSGASAGGLITSRSEHAEAKLERDKERAAAYKNSPNHDTAGGAEDDGGAEVGDSKDDAKEVGDSTVCGAEVGDLSGAAEVGDPSGAEVG